MKRHVFDPTSFVLGLASAAVGPFFLVGHREGHRLEVDLADAAGKPRAAVCDLGHPPGRARHETIPESADEELQAPGEDEP